MGEGCGDYVAGGGGWGDVAVEVPLGDGGCGCRTLDPADDGEGPDVHEDEVDGEPPACGVDDEFGEGC